MLTKDDLAQKAKHLAYLLFGQPDDWEQLPDAQSLLETEPGAILLGSEEGSHVAFTSLQEVHADGSLHPLSEKTKEQMRAFHDNIRFSHKRTITIPPDWTVEEAQLAAMVVEGALFRQGFEPYLFRDIGSLIEISVMGVATDCNPYIECTTNVKGHVDTLDYKNTAMCIDHTVETLGQGWVEKQKNGRKLIEKPVDISGNFPFLDQFMHIYGNAADMQPLVHSTVSPPGGMAHVSKKAQDRYMTLLTEFGIHPIIGVSVTGKAVDHLLINGLGAVISRERPSAQR